MHIEEKFTHNDNFIKEIFRECTSIATGCDYCYGYGLRKNYKVESDLVLLGVMDAFNMFEFDGNNLPVDQNIQLLAHKHPNTLFVVFHPYYSSKSFKYSKNIKFVHWTNNCAGIYNYSSFEPVLDKDVKEIGISLNRQMREHRLFLTSYLYGLQLDKHIKISAVHLDINKKADLMSYVPWDFDNNTECRDIGIRGYSRMYADINKLHLSEPYKMLEGTTSVPIIHNASNFNNTLRHLYRHSLVELVTETLYDVEEGMLTEKYINSVYGCNFPILLSSAGTVQHLRNMGFDMFDDVVDHSYDNITNPASRLEAAVQLNMHLFTNKNDTINKWKLHKERFKINAQFAKTKFIKYLKNRTLNEFKHAIK